MVEDSASGLPPAHLQRRSKSARFGPSSSAASRHGRRRAASAATATTTSTVTNAATASALAAGEGVAGRLQRRKCSLPAGRLVDIDRLGDVMPFHGVKDLRMAVLMRNHVAVMAAQLEALPPVFHSVMAAISSGSAAAAGPATAAAATGAVEDVPRSPCAQERGVAGAGAGAGVGGGMGVLSNSQHNVHKLQRAAFAQRAQCAACSSATGSDMCSSCAAGPKYRTRSASSASSKEMAMLLLPMTTGQWPQGNRRRSASTTSSPTCGGCGAVTSTSEPRSAS